jgi:hypothetical protein
MMHDHAAFGIGHNSGCRLCTCTDPEGLIEQLAAELWESRQEYDRFIAWADAGEYWHHAFRGFAWTALQALSGATSR